MVYAQELETAKRAALLAGAEIMKIYTSDSGFAVEHKGDHSPLTVADKRANQVIVDILRERFPDYSLLSEEEKDEGRRLKNSLCFIVDPLDGTKEFIKQNGQFTVNIALVREHRSVMGVIYAPAKGELYFASEGSGAFFALDGEEPVQIEVSNRIEDLTIAVSLSHAGEQEQRLIDKYGIQRCVRMGSSLKGCAVARGEADIYFRFGTTMEWDTAAMQCIAEEAGGIFRQMDDSLMCYNREDSLNAKGFYIINRIENKLVL